jgi:hypothetical protein
LLGQLFNDLGGLGQTIARFTNTEVNNNLGDFEFAHNIFGLILGGLKKIIA